MLQKYNLFQHIDICQDKIGGLLSLSLNFTVSFTNFEISHVSSLSLIFFLVILVKKSFVSASLLPHFSLSTALAWG
jgi:hypothetical protein